MLVLLNRGFFLINSYTNYFDTDVFKYCQIRSFMDYFYNSNDYTLRNIYISVSGSVNIMDDDVYADMINKSAILLNVLKSDPLFN